MNRRNYSQKVGEWIENQSGCTLSDLCYRFGYNPIYSTIIGFDSKDEKKNGKAIRKSKTLTAFYSKAYKDEGFMRRCGKNRTVTSYCQYLIVGWIMEDLSIEMFRRQGIDIYHNGTDCKREIEIDGSVTQNPDCIVKIGENTRKVELSNEFNSILEDYGFIEKRVPALYTLWKDKGIWLYRDLLNGKYVLIDFAVEKVKLHLRRHNTVKDDWSKDVHRYVLEENGKRVRDERLLAAELISVAGCGIGDKEQPILEEVIDKDSPPLDWDVGGIRKAEENQNTSSGTEDKRINDMNEQQEEIKAQKTNQEEKQKEQQILPSVQEQEDPDMIFDVSDDDGETDWDSVAMANSQAIEF